MTRFGGRIAAIGLALTLASTAAALASAVTLTETGSTLLFPLFAIWGPQYAREDPGFKIVASGTGSGAGISQALAGTVQIGASDAFMSDDEMKANPSFVNVPLAISALTVNYDIPGLNHTPLRLDGPALAGIYGGTIRSWDAEPIATLNPGVKLPHRAIVPIRRDDGSGDTFVFSQYLSFSTPAWENGPGFGTTISWPDVTGTVAARGNSGVLEALRRTPYSVAYVGVSFHAAIATAGVGTALVRNEDGAFVLPTAQTVRAAADVLGPRTPADERLSLVFAHGAESYPLVNYEYAIVSTKQPNAAMATAIRQFLFWSVSTCRGNSKRYLDAVHFIALPDYIRALSEVQIAKIR